MDTKSKKLRYNIWFKIIAWAVCIAAMCGIVFSIRGLARTDVVNAVPNYVDSYDCIGKLDNSAELVRSAFFEPDDAQVGRAVDEYVTSLNEQQDEEAARVMEMEPALVAEAYASGGTGTETAASETAVESGGTYMQEGTAGAFGDYQQKRLQEIQQKYAALIDGAEEKVRGDFVEQRKKNKQMLDKNADVLYAVVRDGQVVHTNVEGADPLGAIRSATANQGVIFGDNGTQEYWNARVETIEESDVPAGGLVVNVAMTEEAYQRNLAAYNRAYDEFKYFLAWLVACIVAFVAGFVWLMVSAGRTVYGEEPALSRADRIVYLDLGFLLVVLLEILFFLGALASLGTYTSYGEPQLDAVGVLGVCACAAGGVSVLLLWATSLSRRAKTGTANEFTLAYQVFGGIKKAYDASGSGAKAVGAFVWYEIAGLLVAAVTVAGLATGGDVVLFLIGVFLMVLYIVLSLRYVLKKAAAVHAIETGVEEIKSGNTEYVIPATGNREMDRIASGINNIAEGLSSAVKKEVKSERMKTELITNISHDLKTPLTSILTYVDLMKKEEDLPERAKKYLEVLDMKSHRLKVLTDDLFEAAKASSGDMTVNLTRIELVQFMEQAMGELSDRMEESDLEFLSEIPHEKMFVSADGKLLFRVIGNVFDNVIKYAMPDTRVYVEIKRTGGQVCVVVKNISKERLNITEEELMERFVRGDSSRNTEGSGLGLAIARNFMQLMGGKFLIGIDGDLFKVTVCLPESV